MAETMAESDLHSHIPQIRSQNRGSPCANQHGITPKKDGHENSPFSKASHGGYSHTPLEECTITHWHGSMLVHVETRTQMYVSMRSQGKRKSAKGLVNDLNMVVIRIPEHNSTKLR
jgi:hypothetical protein